MARLDEQPIGPMMNFDFELYLEHFGLSKRPFTLVPDPDFVFWSRQHRKAQAILEYGLVARAPVTMVTGEVGSGKTTLLRDLLGKVGDDMLVGFIANAAPTDRADMLRMVLHALGEDPSETASYTALYKALETLMIEEYSQGRRVVLIFDEAQNLGRESLEHLRMLTNINFADHELVQLVLVGQPELQDIIMRSDMTQMAQRISASVFLKRLGSEDVGDYITHRMTVAGATEPVFDPETFPLIHEVTGGTPRLINQLCDFALLYAYVEDHKTVSVDAIKNVLNDNLFFCAGRNKPVVLVPNGTKETPPGTKTK